MNIVLFVVKGSFWVPRVSLPVFFQSGGKLGESPVIIKTPITRISGAPSKKILVVAFRIYRLYFNRIFLSYLINFWVSTLMLPQYNFFTVVDIPEVATTYLLRQM